MKVLIAAVLVALIVYVSAEECDSTQQCTDHHITSCGGVTHIQCVRVSSAHHNCHCTDGGSGGQSCTGNLFNNNCHCSGHRGFCNDGTCHCVTGG